MRIIGGDFKGLRLNLPKGGKIRPTTDRAKEALFNHLEHSYHLSSFHVYDLFSGSGSMAFEFASRGCKSVLSMDNNARIISYLNQFCAEHDFSNLTFKKSNVFGFLKSGLGDRANFQKIDLVFADPPYDHPKLNILPNLIFDSGILSEEGLVIIERPKQRPLAHPNYQNSREYGQSVFDFFQKV